MHAAAPGCPVTQPTNQPTNARKKKEWYRYNRPPLSMFVIVSCNLLLLVFPVFLRLVKGRREDIGTSHGVKLANPRLPDLTSTPVDALHTP